MRAIALDDLPSAQASLAASLLSLRRLLLPPSPSSSLSALLELKPGVGGGEATIFAADLVRMYQRLAARKGWKASVVESVGVEGMGAGQAYKEVLMEVGGDGAFGYLRREAGVHRVQRIPATETKGRVHSSTVAVLVRRASFLCSPAL
jgi:peptide chain release factor 1